MMAQQRNVYLMEAMKKAVINSYEANHSPAEALTLVRDIYMKHAEIEKNEHNPTRLTREYSRL